jgi:hypothetical protein
MVLKNIPALLAIGMAMDLGVAAKTGFQIRNPIPRLTEKGINHQLLTIFY